MLSIKSIGFQIPTTCLTPFKNQLTLSVMLVLMRRFPLFLLSPPTESNGLVYYSIHTSEFRRTSSKRIIARSIIIIPELKPIVIATGMNIISKSEKYCIFTHFYLLFIAGFKETMKITTV